MFQHFYFWPSCFWISVNIFYDFHRYMFTSAKRQSFEVSLTVTGIMKFCHNEWKTALQLINLNFLEHYVLKCMHISRMSIRFLKRSKMINCAFLAELLKTNYFLKIHVFQSNCNLPIFITLLFTWCLQISGKPLTTDMLRIFME